MWVPEFTEYSIALTHVGDISVPFRTRYGIHIVQYASDLPSGEVPLAQVYDTIKAELLADKQAEAYCAQVAQWVADAAGTAAAQ
jgi:parvulin-like peptidyl-prolyl isomerase